MITNLIRLTIGNSDAWIGSSYVYTVPTPLTTTFLAFVLPTPANRSGPTNIVKAGVLYLLDRS